ncbi:L-aspartate oxidase [Betaproteobacteria bacterium]|nr:L-aspartate oxidase [Betaproteobacteria bacterium]GHT95042.1 L-aspartate oxidase [Betaproteobacteria bacterium]GHU11179.1 L-aspartate oxidase [Betaproteobacteria bacterium]GHU25088.1 L-aspartate oxidase [Betaproteobacteria bacterium]GHU31644.1 L-aspartate oxidase [Betaproteobacteria bacterium]
MTRQYQYDVLIIGSGAAGQSIALCLADHLRVALVTKRALSDSASALAQGGIAAVLDTDDSIEAHIRDTYTAGAGLCDPASTRFVVEHGREAIAWLIERGVPFTREDQSSIGYHLTREGGHSHRRIIHAADATGQAVQATLSEAVLAHPNIDIFEHHIAIDLIQSERIGHSEPGCIGAYVLDINHDRVVSFAARNTVLATGGTGKVYLFTTNPDVATGDGVAMAWRAGCRVRNMEFIQFHPTCLYHPHAKSFLISEAVRGEGGLLKLPDGTRFMPAHDERAELAPRDIVARAIDFEMKKHGIDCVYLDIAHKGEAFIKEHFPNIHARCLELGINITRESIPVVPAAHYSCGGIVTDLAARTDVPHLYAVGESAGTGLHGANRLASNSLLECLVFGEAATLDILSQPTTALPGIPAWDESRVSDADEEIVIAHNWIELRQAMWDYVGIVRTNKRLQRAQHRIRLLAREIEEFYSSFRVFNDLIELRNLVLTAELIVRCALQRKESRGLHCSRDYPDTLPKAKDTILRPPRFKRRAQG